MSTRPPTTLRGAATLDAAQWHALHRQRALTDAERAQFIVWLTRSPEHVREYLGIVRVAGELGPALRAMDLDVDAMLSMAPVDTGNVIRLPPRTQQAKPVSPARGMSRIAAVAASISLVVAATTWLAWPRTFTYTTAHAEQRIVQLPDASTVHLNAESQVHARFGLLGRKVTLIGGQASFEVAEDRRPFEVHAAGMQVRDIGTTFDVSLQREQLRIGVSEGRVQISGQRRPHTVLADLGAGQIARIRYDSHAVRLSEADADAITAWWQRRIVFQDESLADVATQFNRINRTRLVVDDAQAAGLRVTGNLRADDLESLRLFLSRHPRLQVSSIGDDIHVRSAMH